MNFTSLRPNSSPNSTSSVAKEPETRQPPYNDDDIDCLVTALAARCERRVENRSCSCSLHLCVACWAPARVAVGGGNLSLHSRLPTSGAVPDSQERPQGSQKNLAHRTLNLPSEKSSSLQIHLLPLQGMRGCPLPVLSRL